MKIDSKDKMFGFPIIKIRQIIRNAGNNRYTECNFEHHIDEIALFLKTTKKKTKQLFVNLFSEGYLEYHDFYTIKNHFIGTTVKGQAIANATADKPITRKTADKNLVDLLSRVKQINEQKFYAYLINKVIVFGSYLSNKQRISDLDLAIEYKQISEDEVLFKKRCEERIKIALSNGRIFGSYFEELLWPKSELYLLLKSNKKSISIHSIDDKVINDSNSRIIYEYKCRT